MVKDEKGDLKTDSHSILARWMNHLSQLINVVASAGGELTTDAFPPVHVL